MRFDEAYFDAGLQRKGTASEKWDGMIEEMGDPDMLPMWVADMDFPSPPAVQQACARVAAQGTWGYTMSGKEDAQALAGFWARRHQLHVAPDWVLMSPCVVSSLRLCVRTLTQPGEGVLVTPPVYGPFFAAIRDSGRTIVESPLQTDAQGLWRMDFEDVAQKLASGEARAVMLCSPHNPGGRAWSQEELQQLLALCRTHRAPLICDEIHADFVYAPNRHHSVLSFPEAEEIVVMLCAASKTFNIAGLRQSAIVCPDQAMREALAREMTACGVVNGNPFSLAATRAAYTDSDAWLDGLLPYLAGNRDLVMAHAQAHWPNIRVMPLEATYLMWLDCRTLGLSQKALAERTHAAHVRLNDGTFFGSQGEGFLRLNIGCPRGQLREALHRLDAVLGG